jgi:acetyl esterase/lipase
MEPRHCHFNILLSALILLVLGITGCAVSPNDHRQGHNGAGPVAIEPDESLMLWPEGAPGSPEPLPSEEIVYRTNNYGLIDRAAHSVVRPSLSVFRPKAGNGGSILMVPGGGYSWVVIDKEGFESAAFYTSRGYTVYVLRYRLPHQGWAAGPDTPLQDAQRAMQIIRKRNQSRGGPTDKIMVMGFSAGGHVAGSLASRFDEQIASTPPHALDAAPIRPDLAVLMYPVVTMTPPNAHPKSRENLLGKDPSDQMVARYSLETGPNPNSPPTFILHASDDPAVPVENALMLFQALRTAKVPVTLHLFERGGHGFGMRGIVGTPLAVWPNLVLDWAVAQGFPKPIEGQDALPAGVLVQQN